MRFQSTRDAGHSAGLGEAIARGLAPDGGLYVPVSLPQADVAGLAAADDTTIFEHAEREQRVIVSADTDFGTLLALRNSQRPSVILFRGATPRHPNAQLQLLLANLGEIAASIAHGAVVVLEPQRIRVRTLPISPS